MEDGRHSQTFMQRQQKDIFYIIHIVLHVRI